MRLSSLLFCAVLVGCFNPNYGGTHFTCTEENPICPDGLECIQGWCGGPASTGGDGGQTAGDGGSNADMAVKSGCKSGSGYYISPMAFACPGIYSADPAQLCASGWTPCAKNPMSVDDCNVPKPFKNVYGFYIGSTRGAGSLSSSPLITSCSWAGASSQEQRYVFGCGAIEGCSQGEGCGGFNGPRCGSYEKVAICERSGAGYPIHCPKSVPGQESDWLLISNSDPNNGVLCCKQ